MLKVWTVLLLCGLLPIQQAAAQDGRPATDEYDFGTVGGVLEVLGVGRLVIEDILRYLRTGTVGNKSGQFSDPFERQRRDLLGGALGNEKDLPGNVSGGKEGLLGRLLNLLNWKMANATLMDLKMKPLPGVRLQLRLRVKLDVLGNIPGAAPRKARPSGAPTDLLHLLMEVNINASLRMVKDESGAPKLVVENYMTDLDHIELLPGTMLQRAGVNLSNLFKSLLPGVDAPVADLEGASR